MKRQAQIESALDRSLREQVKVRRLDGKFDAAVWARIEAEESRQSTPVVLARSSASPVAVRWFYAINILGLGSVAIFLCVYGAQLLAGMDVSAMMPELSADTRTSILVNASTVVAAIAVAIGLMFTPLGRKVRAEFG
jgi:hypothetical protein